MGQDREYEAEEQALEELINEETHCTSCGKEFGETEEVVGDLASRAVQCMSCYNGMFE